MENRSHEAVLLHAPEKVRSGSADCGLIETGAFTNESRPSPSVAVPVSTSIFCSNSCSCEGGFCSGIDVSSTSSLS
ncbi:hypothetical protein G3M48_001949 [Beauveria asiatica]|uniref:Uncharacterized protein n=1 Tax=Beauveria asiatica TaxID=1069075 RepID=A0AAW0S0A5_9HYPO